LGNERRRINAHSVWTGFLWVLLRVSEPDLYFLYGESVDDLVLVGNLGFGLSGTIVLNGDIIRIDLQRVQ